jgi:membrane associated rhomboid family serine protease/Flp pilus assembly protein TadD
MPACRTCGHDLPSSFFEGNSDQCPACRAGYGKLVAAPESTPLAVSQPRPIAQRRYPPVTTALLAINTAVWALMVLRGVSPIEPDTVKLLNWGADYGPLSLASQPWRILSSNYLHGGIIHLALNMWCLWNLGALAERIFDRWTYVLVYTGCGIAGSIASLWFHPSVVGVGASGAIFGIAGALIAALYLGRLPVPKHAIQGTLRSLLIFAGYNLFFGTVAAGIDNSAHIGGLVAGLAVGAALAPHLISPLEIRHAWRRWVLIVMAIVLFAGFMYVKKSRAYVTPLQAASDAFDHGNYDQAIAELQNVLTRSPNDASAQALMGASYLQQKEFDKAEQALNRALQLKPRDPYAEYWLGVLYETTGRHEEARKVLTDLVEQEPKQAAGLVLLGYTLEKLNRVDEAISLYSRAAAADPKDEDTQRVWGSALLNSGHVAEAVLHLEQATRMDPKDATAEEYLAKAYAAQGMKEAAEAAAKKAHDLRGNNQE